MGVVPATNLLRMTDDDLLQQMTSTTRLVFATWGLVITTIGVIIATIVPVVCR